LSRCSICRAEFEKRSMSAKTCGEAVCKAEHKRQVALKKAQREETRIRKDKIKSRTEWLDDCQKIFNRYIVLRDGKTCISCGTSNPLIQYCAGHYRSRGAAPQHRFNEQNVHSQCNHHCNMQLAGNIINYRPALIAKIGLEAVEALENDNVERRYTVEEIKGLIEVYKGKVKELKNMG